MSGVRGGHTPLPSPPGPVGGQSGDGGRLHHPAHLPRHVEEQVEAGGGGGGEGRSRGGGPPSRMEEGEGEEAERRDGELLHCT